MHHVTALENLYYINNHPNQFVKYGKKCFSQTDEDGLTLEIIRRINPTKKTFLEIGVSNGMENNTLILAALGWKGQWIGNEDLVVDFPNYTKAFITGENANRIINVDPFLVSIDIDGNDYYLLKAILAVKSPEVIIIEYNAKFPPPVEFIMPYDPEHVWRGSDYFGVSLQSLVNALPDYSLVVCNATTGANAFFVHNKYSGYFNILPIEHVYVPPRYQVHTTYGTHQPVPQTINAILNAKI